LTVARGNILHHDILSRREPQAIGITAVLLALAAFVAYGRFLIVPL
jgi:hypothetical protein